MNMGSVGALAGSAASQISNSADLVIAVGTRLADFTTGSKTTFSNAANMIAINVAPVDAYKMFAVPVVADAKRALEALTKALKSDGYKGVTKKYRSEAVKYKKEWDALVDTIKLVDEPDNLSQGEVLGMTNDVFGGDAVVINAAGSIPGEIPKIWRPTRSDSYHLEYGFSCMGYEIPAGLGVRLADPKRDIVYLMMNSAIVTAVVENMNLTIVVVDNHGFQSIHGLQQSMGTPHFGLELRHRNKKNLLDGNYAKVDYAKHASQEAYIEALEKAKSTKGVNVVVVEVDPTKRVGSYAFGGWWDCPPPEVSKQKKVKAVRAQYEKDRKKQIKYK